MTEQLRGIKDAHDLTLADLAESTFFSKASWERWLNGKRLITREALTGLIAAVECDGAPLLALYEEAAAAHGSPSPDIEPRDVEPPAEPPAGERPEPTRPTRRRARLAATVGALVLMGGGIGFWAGHGSKHEPAPPAAPSGSARKPPCEGIGCAGKDPQSTGCGDDARTLLTTHDGKVVLYLHYSLRCLAAWASLTDGEPGDTATITTTAGQTETALIHWGYDNYSAMVDAHDPTVELQVCGTQPAGSACTRSVHPPTR